MQGELHSSVACWEQLHQSCWAAACRQDGDASMGGGAGVVEAWAGGSSWDQVTKDCNLDDGDIARLLNRQAP